MNRGIQIAVLSALLALTSCATTTGEAQPTTPTTAPTTEPIPRTPDRDPAAVTAALRAIDPCLLLGESGGVPTGPHSCELRPADITVEVGVFSDHFRRHRGETVTVGGRKGYRYRSGPDDVSANCRVVLPVSATLGIQLRHALLEQGEACPDLMPHVDAAVAKLEKPDAIAIDTAERPFSAWDGCSLLARVLEPEDFTYRPGSARDSFSSCDTERDGRSAGISLEAYYDEWEPSSSEDERQVAGKPGTVSTRGGTCRLTWNQADSGVESHDALVFEVATEDCDTAGRLAEEVSALAGTEPEPANIKPQRPMLYEPDENDTATVGACVDHAIGDDPRCEPFRQDTPLPQDVDALLTAAEEDGHVQCAIFNDAVRAVYGDDLQPVVLGAKCFFVEPTHTLQLTTEVDDLLSPSTFEDRPSVRSDWRVTEVGGKQAVSFFSSDRSKFELYVSPHNDIERDGYVHFSAEAKIGRGVEHTDPEIDPERLRMAEQVTAQAIRRYFG